MGLAAGGGIDSGRAVRCGVNLDLRQQRHRKEGQRNHEPADVIAVDIAVVVGQLLGLKALEDKAIAERQHQVVAQKTDAGQHPNHGNACLEALCHRRQNGHDKDNGNQRHHVAALANHA